MDNVSLYVEKSEGIHTQTLRMNKLAGYKVSIQSSVAFLYINVLKMELRK